MYSNDISDLHILERLSLDLVGAIRVLDKHEHGVRSRGALDKAYLAVREAHATLYAHILLDTRNDNGGDTEYAAARVIKSMQPFADDAIEEHEQRLLQHRRDQIVAIERRIQEYENDREARAAAEEAKKRDSDIKALREKLARLKETAGDCIYPGQPAQTFQATQTD